MINLDVAFAPGVAVMSTFQANGIEPNVVLTATDADVIKAYVAAGLGIATLPEVAFDPRLDLALTTIKARHLFPLTSATYGYTDICIFEGTHSNSFGCSPRRGHVQ